MYSSDLDVSKLVSELSPLEWVAAAVTLANVLLAMRARIWNFPVGAVSAALYGVVFYQQKLYANAGLQVIYYLPMMVVGWVVWMRTGPTKQDDLPIQSPGRNMNLWFALATLLAMIPLQFLLSRINGTATWLDAFTTAISITGQIYLTKKWIENWAYWVVGNAVYAFVLFPGLKMWASTGLYCVMLTLSFIGWWQWSRSRGEIRA